MTLPGATVRGEPVRGEPVRVTALEGGLVRAITLSRPKANVLDGATIHALGEAFHAAAADPCVRAVLLAAEGPHFSFGASVEEHLPGREKAMLEALHALLRGILATDLPLVAVIRGQCLGAGLELVLLAHRIVAAPDARLGQPEIGLGVIAPAASVLLLERVGRPVAEDLLLSGRSVDAAEALRVGLVDEVAAEPAGAALAWIRTHLLAKSASSLRCAVRAARVGLIERVERDLPRIESLYLERLMRTRDAEEGLRAFLEKRLPRWRDA